MKNKKKRIILIVVIVILIASAIGGYFAVKYIKSIKEHVKFKEIAVVQVDDVNKIDKNKYIYCITSKKELEKWGIDTSNIKKQKNEQLVYSLGYRITDVWYKKYAPEYYYGDGTGPIILDTKYKIDKPHNMYIYAMDCKDIQFYEYHQMK